MLLRTECADKKNTTKIIINRQQKRKNETGSCTFLYYNPDILAKK